MIKSQKPLRVQLATLIALIAFVAPIFGCNRLDDLPGQDQYPPLVVPGPGSTFSFAWADYDSAETLVRNGNDTIQFVVLDTGLTLFGRKSVSKMLGIMHDTFYVTYERPSELQYTSQADQWPGWMERPQIVVRMDDLPSSSIPAEAWWFAPEIGFVVRFASYEIHDSHTVLRVHRLTHHYLQ
jgi:hypothetical protein